MTIYTYTFSSLRLLDNESVCGSIEATDPRDAQAQINKKYTNLRGGKGTFTNRSNGVQFGIVWEGARA